MKNEKLSIKKFKISKLDNLSKINGGDNVDYGNTQTETILHRTQNTSIQHPTS